MTLATLLMAIRRLPATPFRSGGAPQLADALESIVGRSFGVKPANMGAVESRGGSVTAVEEGIVSRAEECVLRIEEGAARKEVSAVTLVE